MALIAWRTVFPLREGEAGPPRRRLTVAEAGDPSSLRPEALPGIRRVLFVLEEDEARLLGVDLETFPAEPAPVALRLEILR
jgi:hypothetical protein